MMGLDYSDLLPGAEGGDGSVSGSGAASGLSTSKKDFIKRLIKVAMEGYRSKRVLPSVHIAQAIHESSWGNSGLAQKGKNLFGFKCGTSWDDLFRKHLIFDVLSCLPYGVICEEEEQCLINNLNENCNC
jgi:hypothetical protein